MEATSFTQFTTVTHPCAKSDILDSNAAPAAVDYIKQRGLLVMSENETVYTVRADGTGRRCCRVRPHAVVDAGWPHHFHLEPHRHVPSLDHG